MEESQGLCHGVDGTERGASHLLQYGIVGGGEEKERKTEGVTGQEIEWQHGHEKKS